MFDKISGEIESMRDNIKELRKNLSLYSIHLNTLDALWDNIPAIIFYKDNLNTLVKVNDYFCKVMNCKKEDVEGKNICEMTKDDVLAAKYASNDLFVLNTGVPKLGIEEPLFDTGIQLRTDKFPIKINGKIEGIMGFSVIVNKE